MGAEGVFNLKIAIISIESATYGIKAKKLLAEKGINSKLVKTSEGNQEKGCAYGIEVEYQNLFIAKKILSDAKIPFSVIR